MKTLIRTMAVVAVVAVAGEARAQSVRLEEPLYGVAAGAGALVAAHFAGFGTIDALRNNGGRRWVIANFVVGAANVAHGVGWFFVEGRYAVRRPSREFAALGIAQVTLGGLNLAVALLNVVLPNRPETERVTPVVLSGRTANGTGRRWSGVGLEVQL